MDINQNPSPEEGQMTTREPQDRAERAVYARMLDGETFFDAVESVEYEEHLFEVQGASAFSATVEMNGQSIDLDPDWIMRRNYPR